MRKILGAAVVGASLLASPAFAGDLGPFTGGRIEAIGGWDQPRVRQREDDGHRHTFKKSGGMVGVQGGYDLEYKNFLVGIDGEVSFSSVKKTARDSFTAMNASNVATAYDMRSRLRIRRDLGIGLRAGGVIADHVLLYGKIGYSNGKAQVKTRVWETATDVEVLRVKHSKTNGGIRFGAGAEYLIGHNFYVKGEYRYTSYGHKFNRNQLVGGIGVRF